MFTLRSNAVAITALAVALSGSAYAVTALPKNSIGGKQIKPGAVHKSDVANGAVTSKKIRDGAVGAADLAPGVLPAKGDTGPQGPAGTPGAKGDVGPTQGFSAARLAGANPPSAPSGNVTTLVVTTSAAGSLFVFGRGSVNVTCTAGPVQLGLFVDDVAVPGSGQPLASGVTKEVAMFGLSAPVAAGDHTVSMKRECTSGTFTGSSFSGAGELGAILLGG